MVYFYGMAKRWTKSEEENLRKELYELYVSQNMTIGEISKVLLLEQSTIHKRLVRLSIPVTPEKKKNYQNKRTDIIIPKSYSKELAEIIGILLGDGSLTHFQVMVTLGNKEYSYAEHVQHLLNNVFHVDAKIGTRETKYHDVYFGSVEISSWLQNQGLVFNKVREQVDVPVWIFSRVVYKKACIRGFFDTDGSVYKLRHGIQLSFTNYSRPLLLSLRKMLFELEYKPSRLSSHKIYLTRKEDVLRFIKEIQPKNEKHLQRFKMIMRQSYSGNYRGL